MIIFTSERRGNGGDVDYPFVSVILATYNRKEWLRECLESLFSQNYPEEKYEIIVINDGSADGTREVLREYKKKVPHRFRWYSQGNRGKAAALNLGIRNIRGEIVCFTDDDCIADRNWIRNLLDAFDSEKIGGVGGRILAYKPKKLIEKYGVLFNQEDSVALATGNAAYRAHVIKSVGGFDTQLIGLEDIDFGVRVRGKGYRLKYTYKAVVYHRNYDTLGKLIRRKYLEGKQLYNLSTKYTHYFNVKKLALKFSLGVVRRASPFANLHALMWSKNGDGYFFRELFETVVLASTLMGLAGGMLHKKIYSYKGNKICDKYDFEFD